MDQLIDAFELLLLRIRCGQTLTQSMRGLASPKVNAELNSQWQTLFLSIQKGSLRAEPGIQAFLGFLKLQRKLSGLLSQKTLLPKLQSLVIMTISAGFLLAGYLLFPDTLRPTSSVVLVSLTLNALGFLLNGYLIRSFEKDLWFAEWLMFLSNIQNNLNAGFTLARSLSVELENLEKFKNWPKSLLSDLVQLGTCIQQGTELPNLRTLPSRAKASHQQAHEHLKLLTQQYSNAEPLSELLSKLLPSCAEVFERQITMESEKLSLKILVPMFLFYFPSFLVLLFGPLLRGIQESLTSSGI